MNRKKTNLLMISIVMTVTAFSFDGCSKPKVVEYKPYQTNTYLYREIVDKNKLEWRESLLGDVKAFKNYVTSVFNKIDNHKTYLEKTHNVKVMKTNRARKEKKDDDVSYGDVIFDDEYSF